MRPILYGLLLLLPYTTLHAQEFSGGFRAGLNFISFEADAEMDSDGMTLEEFKRTTGFHVGATFAFEITDLVGLKADLMYSQKGGEVLYEGPSYLFLYTPDGQAERIQGSLQSERDVLNSYIDIPVVAYYRLGPLELEGGLSAGLLVNSRASGSAAYSNTFDSQGRGLGTIVYNYDFNYSDEVTGRDAVLEFADAGGLANVPAVVNAYYNSTDSRPLYRRLDFGLVGGVSFFLNNGLYVGARYLLGLTDTTRGENDQRLFSDPNTVAGELEYNTDDKDYNRVIQASVGFRF